MLTDQTAASSTSCGCLLKVAKSPHRYSRAQPAHGRFRLKLSPDRARFAVPHPPRPLTDLPTAPSFLALLDSRFNPWCSPPLNVLQSTAQHPHILVNMSETDTLNELRAKVGLRRQAESHRLSSIFPPPQVLGVVENPLPASAFARTTVEEMKAFLKKCELPWPNAEQKGLLTPCQSFALAHADRASPSHSPVHEGRRLYFGLFRRGGVCGISRLPHQY